MKSWFNWQFSAAFVNDKKLIFNIVSLRFFGRPWRVAEKAEQRKKTSLNRWPPICHCDFVAWFGGNRMLSRSRRRCLFVCSVDAILIPVRDCHSVSARIIVSCVCVCVYVSLFCETCYRWKPYKLIFIGFHAWCDLIRLCAYMSI